MGFDKGMSEGGVAALNLRQRVAFVLPGVCITKHTSHKEFVNDTTHSNNTTLIEKKKSRYRHSYCHQPQELSQESTN